jgi:hypothetical protein
VLTVPWLTRLVAVLSLRRPGFDPKSGRVGFVNKVASGRGFCASASVFPCHRSASATYSFHSSTTDAIQYKLLSCTTAVRSTVVYWYAVLIKKSQNIKTDNNF